MEADYAFLQGFSPEDQAKYRQIYNEEKLKVLSSTPKQMPTKKYSADPYEFLKGLSVEDQLKYRKLYEQKMLGLPVAAQRKRQQAIAAGGYDQAPMGTMGEKVSLTPSEDLLTSLKEDITFMTPRSKYYGEGYQEYEPDFERAKKEVPLVVSEGELQPITGILENKLLLKRAEARQKGRGVRFKGVDPQALDVITEEVDPNKYYRPDLNKIRGSEAFEPFSEYPTLSDLEQFAKVPTNAPAKDISELYERAKKAKKEKIQRQKAKSGLGK